MKIVPGRYRMRNGSEAIVERVKAYTWDQPRKGSITLAEGVHCGSWNLGMWSINGQAAPSPKGAETQFDLIEFL